MDLITVAQGTLIIKNYGNKTTTWLHPGPNLKNKLRQKKVKYLNKTLDMLLALD